MNAVDSALAMFQSHPSYGTITVPERQQMEELITQLFMKTHTVAPLEITFRKSRSYYQRDFTVISFGNHSIQVRKTVGTTKYWLLKNTHNGNALRYEMPTKTVVMHWVDPSRAKVISVDYGKDEADCSDFCWIENEDEPSVEDSSVHLETIHYVKPRNMTWTEIVQELEEASLVKTRMADHEFRWSIVIEDISELEGNIHIDVDSLESKNSLDHEPIRQHFLYLYSKLLG